MVAFIQLRLAQVSNERREPEISGVSGGLLPQAGIRPRQQIPEPVHLADSGGLGQTASVVRCPCRACAALQCAWGSKQATSLAGVRPCGEGTLWKADLRGVSPASCPCPGPTPLSDPGSQSLHVSSIHRAHSEDFRGATARTDQAEPWGAPSTAS